MFPVTKRERERRREKERKKETDKAERKKETDKADRERERLREVVREEKGKSVHSTTPSLNPTCPFPSVNPSVVLFQECSYGQCFPLAETCEDSARSGPRGDLQFYRNIHTDRQHIKFTHCSFKMLFMQVGEMQLWII